MTERLLTQFAAIESPRRPDVDEILQCRAGAATEVQQTSLHRKAQALDKILDELERARGGRDAAQVEDCLFRAVGLMVDRIVVINTLDLLEPRWSPQFLDCAATPADREPATGRPWLT